MKYLTINTHSWLEDNQSQKYQDLVAKIVSEDYDVICLQEINQLITSAEVEAPLNYLAVEGAPAIHEDNYALRLVQSLAEAGHTYYWSWAYNHIGYDRYQEGVAMLSKESFEPEALLVSSVDDDKDYHTRRVLLGHFQKGTVVSLHLSWWDKGFQGEWAILQERLQELAKSLLLLGDFNNPTGQEGYQAILSSPLGLQDSHQVAEISSGDFTITADIDGWEGNQHQLKVDHAFVTDDVLVQTSEVVFDGQNSPVISDHYGLAITFTWRG